MSRHLAVEIDNRLIHLSELSNGEPINEHLFSVTGRTTHEIKTELETFFKEKDLFSDNFDDVTVGIVSKNSTLIPTNIYGESDPKSIYKLCFGELKEGDELDFNRIPEHGVVNVFSLPEWIKSFFVLKFPRVNIQHSGSHMIRMMLHKNTFRTKVGLHLFGDHFLYTIVKHDKLVFYSHFDHQNEDDIVYHTFFVLQQKELIEDKGSIFISNGVGSNGSNNDKILEKFAKIGDLKDFEVSIFEGLHPKSQLLCV